MTMVEFWTALAAVASLLLVGLQAWLSSRPLRKERSATRERTKIHNEIAAGDVDALRARLRRLRAER